MSDIDQINDIQNAAYNAGIVEGEAAARTHIPTVIVAICGDSVPEVLWSDREVNVVIVDYNVDDVDKDAVTDDPDTGEEALIYEVQATVDAEKVRQYLAVLAEAGR